MTLIDDIAPTAPELGILRMGEKGKKGEPVKLSSWRITSHDEIVLAELAALYGGTPRPWEGAPEEGQFELYTDASAIDVLVPPNPISAAYERWATGGCQKRCDGETVTMAKGRGDNAEIVDEPCWCRARGLAPGDEADVKKGACDLYVRLKVLLPNVSGVGTWRLNTSSVFAYRELRGQIEILRRMLATRDADAWMDIPAQLAIEQRRIKKPGQPPKEFVVPVLRMRSTLHELIAASRTGETLALGGAAPVRELEAGARRNTLADKPTHVQELIRACARVGLADDERHRLVAVVSNGRTASARDVTLAEASDAMDALDTGRWQDLIAPPDLEPPAAAAEKPAPRRPPKPPALSDDEAKELRRLGVVFANLPAHLRDHGLDLIAAAGLPEKVDDITPEQLPKFGEIVEALHVTALEGEPPPAAVGAVPEGEPWGRDEWDAAAKTVGFNANRILKEARAFAAELGIEPPKSHEEITDDTLVSRLHSWLREQGGEAA